MIFFFFSSRRRHTRFKCDWSSDVCSSDLGHDGKWFVTHVHQERLVAAYVVNVVDEAERLKNFERTGCAAQPESVEAHRPRTSCPHNALDTLLIGGALFFRSHRKLCGPGLPVSGCFVPTLNNLFCECGVEVHSCAHHMGSDLDLTTVKNVEEPRQTFLEAVVVPFARRQIWIFRIDLRYRTFSSAGRLCAALHLHRDRDNHASAVRPEGARGGFSLVGHGVRESERWGQCSCYGGQGSCHGGPVLRHLGRFFRLLYISLTNYLFCFLSLSPIS